VNALPGEIVKEAGSIPGGLLRKMKKVLRPENEETVATFTELPARPATEPEQQAA